MKHLLEIAVDNGFKIVFGNYTNISTMNKNGLGARFEKDDKVIIWRLNEKGKPPTLTYPTLNILLKRYDSNNQIELLSGVNQDAIEYVLRKENHQFIFDNLYTNYLFEYDTTKNPTK